MGCDIHLYVEYKNKKSDYWMNFGGRFNPGRHYGVFSMLADVRNNGYIKNPFQPKGIPKSLASTTLSEYSLFISDNLKDEEGYTTRENAEKWVKAGYSEMIDSSRVSGPDWHSESWMTVEEYEDAFKKLHEIKTFGDDDEYLVILDMSKSLESKGYDVRIVFWFDN